MKKHIELVKKFLADNDSVTEEELRVNEAAAYAVWDSEAAEAARAYWAAEAAEAARAYWAAAESDNLEDAEYYKKLAIEAVAEYEELTK